MRPSDPVQHARRVAARVVRAGPLPPLRATVGVWRVCMGGTGTQMGLSEIAWVAKRARRGLLHVTRTIAVWSRYRRDRSRSHPTSGITAPRAARGVPYLGHHRAGPGPRCADHSDARGRPDPPTCAGYRRALLITFLPRRRFPTFVSLQRDSQRDPSEHPSPAHDEPASPRARRNTTRPRLARAGGRHCIA